MVSWRSELGLINYEQMRWSSCTDALVCRQDVLAGLEVPDGRPGEVLRLAVPGPVGVSGHPAAHPDIQPVITPGVMSEWWVWWDAEDMYITPNLNKYEVYSDIKKLLLRETWKEAFSDGKKTEHKNDIFYINRYK